MSVITRTASILFVLYLLVTPARVTATVLINEIAWMGTTESHLCNWIEFYNTGDSSVDLEDWTLLINDTARPFADGEGGTGTIIPAAGYFVLERVTNTCPNPVPESNNWYLAFGNLPNSGATLTLLRPNGSVSDEVVGGTDWQNVGGNNDTKQTAQRTPDGWITADPTPGKANAEKAEEQLDGDETPKTTTQTVRSGSSPSRFVSARALAPRPLTLPDTGLALSIVGPEYGYVNQPITLTASSSGVGETIEASLRYQWNWGDMHNSDAGSTATHTYAHPGSYVVTLYASYARQEQVARHSILILPTPLAIEQVGDLVHIHNTAPYEIDVSGVTLSGVTKRVFPERSFIPADATITIPASSLGLTGPRLLVAHDPQGEFLASNHTSLIGAVAGVATTAAPATTEQPELIFESPEQMVTPSVDNNEQFRFSGDEAYSVPTADKQENSENSENATDKIPVPAMTPSSRVDTEAGDPSWWPLLALLGLLFLAMVALLYPRRHRLDESDE